MENLPVEEAPTKEKNDLEQDTTKKLDVFPVRKSFEELEENILRFTDIIRARDRQGFSDLSDTEVITALYDINNEIHNYLEQEEISSTEVGNLGLLFYKFSQALGKLFDQQSTRVIDEVGSLNKLFFSLEDLADSQKKILSSMSAWDLQPENFTPIGAGIKKATETIEELLDYTNRKRRAIEEYDQGGY